MQRQQRRGRMIAMSAEELSSLATLPGADTGS
jgi:hypothetical protein